MTEYTATQKEVEDIIKKALFRIVGGSIPETSMVKLVKEIDAVYSAK